MAVLPFKRRVYSGRLHRRPAKRRRPYRWTKMPAVSAAGSLLAIAALLLASPWSPINVASYLPAGLTGTSIASSASSLSGRASVIDGDTIEIRGQRIRIWGVDAPESRQSCQIEGKPWRCGQQAALALSDWIGQRTVACKEKDRDRYSRIVATCAVGSEDIGAWLVRNGWALDWPRYSWGWYQIIQAQAAARGLGVWRGEFDKPWDWRDQR